MRGGVNEPGSPFHMLRRTCMWLATCFFVRCMPLEARKSTRN